MIFVKKQIHILLSIFLVLSTAQSQAGWLDTLKTNVTYKKAAAVGACAVGIATAGYFVWKNWPRKKGVRFSGGHLKPEGRSLDNGHADRAVRSLSCISRMLLKVGDRFYLTTPSLCGLALNKDGFGKIARLYVERGTYVIQQMNTESELFESTLFEQSQKNISVKKTFLIQHVETGRNYYVEFERAVNTTIGEWQMVGLFYIEN